jgi:hypothetical protein
MNLTALVAAIVLVILLITLRYAVMWRLKYGNIFVFLVWFLFFFIGGVLLSIILEKASGQYDPRIAQYYLDVLFVLLLLWTAEETVKAVKKLRANPKSGKDE